MHPYGPEAEAIHALQNAINATIVADEKAETAEYGDEIMQSLEEARRLLTHALRVMESKT